MDKLGLYLLLALVASLATSGWWLMRFQPPLAWHRFYKLLAVAGTVITVVGTIVLTVVAVQSGSDWRGVVTPTGFVLAGVAVAVVYGYRRNPNN